MKTLTALLLLTSITAFADTTKNPDRYTSVGLDFTHSEEGGVLDTYMVTRADGTMIKHYDFIGYSHSAVNFDLRMPLTNHITFNLHGSPQWSDIPSGTKINGYSFGAGVRFYLPDNIGPAIGTR